MTRTACIGECMVELFERPDGLLQRGFGGDTLNTAIYLARLGMAVDYVTALGRDPFSDEMLRAWRDEGIGTDLVLRCEDALPGLYLIQTGATGERRFSYWRDSAPVRRLFTMPEIARVEASLAGYDILYLSGITLSLFDPQSRARLFGMIDDVRRSGCRIAFDTNFRPRGWPDRESAQHTYRAMFVRTDLLLAGVEDLILLDASADHHDMASTLRASCPGEIVLKLADPGCLVAEEGEWRHVPGLAVASVADTTAAGDSFAAAYIAAREAGRTPAEAAHEGHRLASLVVQHRGAIIPPHLMPDRELHAQGT